MFFMPKIGEDEPKIDVHIFSDGLKPPSRLTFFGPKQIQRSILTFQV